jgi:hypothetical protein
MPTTNLPLGGREGDAPEPPCWIDLGEAGMSWWDWAWHTPQAAAWHDGFMPTIAHRATLEDDLRIINNVDGLDFVELVNKDDEDGVRRAIRCLAALAGDRLKLLKEARELDHALGLTPKGMAALHWKVVADKRAPIVALVPELDDLDD